ncbi:MAG: YceI family protein [Croceibacterium sp.]
MRNWTLPLLGAAALAALSIGTLQAQGGPPKLPGQMDPSRVVAGTYKTDKNHSLMTFRINHFGFSDYFGIFGDIDGTLTIDPKNPAAAKVDATIPIHPVLASQGLHDHLLRDGVDGKKADFFGSKQAPAHFVSTRVVPGANNTAKITGNLTLNGVTKPVTIDAAFVGAGNSMMGNKLTVGFRGTTTLKRSDWGVSGFVPMIGDNVELQISTAFEKQ